ncbi:SRPBCC family protein [Pseudarthrobacter sp. S9]|uniref:SRPBCC family protein n=1 Tax=Pseudarthrobacter sp. S9 TaxID=3418421 RepID=UPI003D02157C
MHRTTRRTTHRLSIDAPEDLIFSMLRDSSHWPYLEGLTVYSERVSGDDSAHELRTSVVANGSLSSSHCRRVFDAAGHRAEFHQLDLEPPLLLLGGDWDIRRAEGLSVVTLNHEYEVDDSEVDGGAGELSERIGRSIDDYSRRELEALRLSCERLALLLQHHSTQNHTTAKEA